MLYSLIQNMLHIDIFSSSYCNMKGHQFCFLFHMIQGMSSASSSNIHFRPNRNSSFHLSYLACWQQCPGHCSIRKPWLIFRLYLLGQFLGNMIPMSIAIVAKTIRIIPLLDSHVNCFSICCFICSVLGGIKLAKRTVLIYGIFSAFTGK